MGRRASAARALPTSLMLPRSAFVSSVGKACFTEVAVGWESSSSSEVPLACADMAADLAAAVNFGSFLHSGEGWEGFQCESQALQTHVQSRQSSM